MTVYNINLGIGWASSGVEYAQAYRAQLLRNQGIPAKFIFTDFISHDNILDLTRNIGFEDQEVIWLYSFFTDQELVPTTFTLADLRQLFPGNVTQEEVLEDVVRLYYEAEDIFLTAYLVKGSQDKVHRVEYVSRGNLIRKDYFTDKRLFTEYYTPRDNKAYLYLRRFFNTDGSVAFDEVIDGENSFFRLADQLISSKDELVAYFMDQLHLTSQDVVILDRSTGTGQAVLSHTKPAKLGVVVHAEHFSENHVYEQTILWNNYYDYTFSNADKIDFFIVATDAQNQLLSQQFETYTNHRPYIVTIPVGSLPHLSYPSGERRPFSLITASRLAGEKHVDWLAKAVVKAKESLPDLQFDIYGTGGEEDKIRQIILDNQAQDYIHLRGHQDMREVYKDYQVYLSASKSEGFGLTLMEAVGSGLPLIGFDVRYGNQTFIKDGQNGYLIPRFETDDEPLIVAALADKICQLYQTPDFNHLHQVSYDLAASYLTPVIEAKWKKLVEEMTQ